MDSGRLKALWARREILETLVRRDLRVRYARSVLGYLWTIIDPLAMALIYFMIFAVIFKRPDAGHHPYFLFLLVGLLAWQWFSSSVTETSRALLPRPSWSARPACPASSGSSGSSSPRASSTSCRCRSSSAFTLFYLVSGDDQPQLAARAAAARDRPAVPRPGGDRTAARAADGARRGHPAGRAHRHADGVLLHPDHLLARHACPESLRTILWFNPMSGVLELYRAGLFDEPLVPQPIIASVVLALVFLVVGADRLQAPRALGPQGDLMTDVMIEVDEPRHRVLPSPPRNLSLREMVLKGRSTAPSKTFWALKDVNFTVGHGEAVGLVGSNGTGKSTLLKTIAGVLIPDEGAGTRPRRCRPAHRAHRRLPR